MLDLHVHSTFSDGSLTPAELVALADDVGLSAIGLTDHDTTDGLGALAAAGRERGIVTVPGVEISVDVRKGSLHMLGYLFDPADAGLSEGLRRIREGRETRNVQILKKLQNLGMDIEWGMVAAHAAEEVVGRPHFAKAMLEGGYVKTKAEAFDRYLAKGQPAYTDRFRLSVEESIDMISRAGGLAVLAHPFTLDLDRDSLRDYVGHLKAAGLQGIEGYYSEYSDARRQEYLALAVQFGLVVTGGSDFHGDMNPAIKLGRGFGSLKVPDSALADLTRRKADLGLSSV